METYPCIIFVKILVFNTEKNTDFFKTDSKINEQVTNNLFNPNF